MPANKRVSDEALLAAYKQTGNVWGAAKLLGLCGQSVHERLVRAGVKRKNPRISEDDLNRLARDYEDHAAKGTLDVLASSMGRTKQFICRHARLMGLTDGKRPKPYLAEGISERSTKWWSENNLPPATIESKRTLMKAWWATLTDAERNERVLRTMATKLESGLLFPPRPHLSWKAGWRVVGNARIYFRSRWEANYARYLEYLRESGALLSWQHEPKTFWFPNTGAGSKRCYLPDFSVTTTDGALTYHEVKGWMDPRSVEALCLMRDCYPDIHIVLVDSIVYQGIRERLCHTIDGWEHERWKPKKAA